ncbi:cyclin-J-like [Branchiostoma floridae x Branchiostoma belcheri]
MEVQKEWWKTQLATDIHETLRTKEAELPPFKGLSPQLGLRRYLVDWLSIINEKQGVHCTALHLAVYLLDQFMDSYDIQESRMHLVALGCLLVACKFEEEERRVPRIKKLNQYVREVYSEEEYLQMELTILKFFQWNISLPTPAHFLDYYMTEGVSQSDLHAGYPVCSVNKSRLYLEKYCHYFLEVSLQDHCFLVFRPSVIAAACVAASRICLHLSPTWTSRLHGITGYRWDHIAPCIETMLKVHEMDVKATKTTKETKDSISSAMMYERGKHSGYNRGYAVCIS